MRRPGYEATSPVLATDEDYKNKNVIKSCRYSKNVIKRLYKHFFFDFLKFFHAFWMYIYCGFECTCSCIILQKRSCRYSKNICDPPPKGDLFIYGVHLWRCGCEKTANLELQDIPPKSQVPVSLPLLHLSVTPRAEHSHRVHLLVSLRGRTSSNVCALYPVTPGVRTPHCSQ